MLGRPKEAVPIFRLIIWICPSTRCPYVLDHQIGSYIFKRVSSKTAM